MTRRDFELIAGAIGALWDDHEADPYTIEQAAHEFAARLSAGNPRFDVPRFLAACWGRK